MFILLQNEDSRTFTADQSRSPRIERTGRTFRGIFIFRRSRIKQVEGARHLLRKLIRTAADHDILRTVCDQAACRSDRLKP